MKVVLVFRFLMFSEKEIECGLAAVIQLYPEHKTSEIVRHCWKDDKSLFGFHYFNQKMVFNDEITIVDKLV